MIERFRVRIPAGGTGEFSSTELTFCADSYSVSVPRPVLPQWHVKDPGHSAKSAGGRLHLNTYTPFAQRSRNGLTKSSVGLYQETSSHGNSSGNTRLQSSQLAEQMWTDPDLPKSSHSRKKALPPNRQLARRMNASRLHTCFKVDELSVPMT